jgi:class 3 adenylate cyclase/tetratricopeptide (TPR) repeat protein
MLRCPGCGEENPPRFRLCGYCGTTLAPAPASLPTREVRKTVTIVFSDLKGSTTLGEHLDSEALHEVKNRYFQAMAAEIARHGGRVEKYIGDAVMAVFGLPRAHEDDALRAVRAALGMQSALSRVNDELQRRYGVTLANRTGINTGEVVASDDPEADQKLATGDAVNVAARLEQAAPENQIYLGDVTYRLVRDAVHVEPVEPLELKGKAQRVSAYKLVSAPGLDGNLRRVDTPIVGRDAELADIARCYREVVEGSAVRMVTVVGDAGVGKSRLVHEVVERIAAGARVLRGRCLPYGDGITFWPLRVMLGAAGIRDDDAPDQARDKLLQALGDAAVVDRIAAAVGLSNATYPLHEVYWAARKVLEILAGDAPVVALIDDIHWAESAFLDLLEHVLATSRGAPILLLATSRHDLLEQRPQWGEQPGAVRIVLAPLTPGAAGEIVTNLLGGTGLPRDILGRIVDTAEGNPLYVEQLLSMLIDRGALIKVDGRWVRGQAGVYVDIPPTIHALLEARLDQLGRPERATVDPASVMGLEFPRVALAELAPQALHASLDEQLSALMRKQFLQPAAVSDGGARFRFHHQLVRDTVYNGLLKRTRAQLHLAFVRWGDRINAHRDRALEFEEILGYHLEQATRCLSELGPLDADGEAAASDGARRLSSAGRRAAERGDMHAAENLFSRALALLTQDEAGRVALMPEYGETLLGLGRIHQAREVLEQAAAAAVRLSNTRVHAQSQLIRLYVALYSGEQSEWSKQTEQKAQALIQPLEQLQAHNELAMAWRLIMLAHGNACRFRLASEVAARALEHARQAGSTRLIAKIGGFLTSIAPAGATPVPEAIAQCERLLADGLRDRLIEGGVMCSLAQLRAMNGELDHARALYRRARSMLHDLGQGVTAASTGLDLAMVELRGGDTALAEREVRADFEFLEKSGEAYYLSSMAAMLARLAREQGRDADALALTERAEAAAASDDVLTQALWRAVRAPVLARSGRLEQAEHLAQGAIALLRDVEAPGFLGDALVDLAIVLRIAGKIEEASQAVDEALALLHAKGDRPFAGRAAALRAELNNPS